MPKQKDNRLLVLWQGNYKRPVIHSQIPRTPEQLLALVCGLEMNGAKILGACQCNSVPAHASPWKVGDPGTEYFSGRFYTGDLSKQLPIRR